MTITVPSLIRAGVVAQKEFDLPENYDLRIFPSDAPEIVEVWETPKPVLVSEDDLKDPAAYARMPEKDRVFLRMFGSDYNMDMIRMGYSRELNILCIALH